MADYVSTERLYLDPDGKVVSADDPSRRTLLVAEGLSLPLARAVELGLAEADGTPIARVVAPADEAPPNDAAPNDAAPEGKAQSGPQANKAQRGPSETK